MIELTTDQLCIILAVDAIIVIATIVGLVYMYGGKDDTHNQT